MADMNHILSSKLYKWITDKVSSYKVSGRKGLPKGSTIPFSMEKYKAALLSCCFSPKKYGLQAIAKDCGVTYGVLKVWRTENRFRSFVDSEEEEFADHFAKLFIKAARTKPENKVLSKEFRNYHVNLQHGIIARIYEHICFLKPDINKRSIKKKYLKEVSLVLSAGEILCRQTLEGLTNERPIKRSNQYEVIYLLSYQVLCLQELHRKIFAVIKEFFLSKERESLSTLNKALDLVNDQMKNLALDGMHTYSEPYLL